MTSYLPGMQHRALAAGSTLQRGMLSSAPFCLAEPQITCEAHAGPPDLRLAQPQPAAAFRGQVVRQFQAASAPEVLQQLEDPWAARTIENTANGEPSTSNRCAHETCALLTACF